MVKKEQTERRSLLRAFYEALFGARVTLSDLDEADRRRIRAAQIAAVAQFVPLTMAINILNAAIIVYAFWDTRRNDFLSIWGSLIVLQAGVALWSWNRSRKNPPTGASSRAIRRSAAHATILGATWGAAALALFPESDTMHQLVIACMMTGMISGGAFGLSTVPNAGLAYTWAMVVPSAAALFLARYSLFNYIATMLMFYAVFISRNLVSHGALFVRHLRDQLKLEAQREVISLLLNDFQEHASDWLWETDASGALTHVSDRFAEAAGQAVADLQGRKFIEVAGSRGEYRSPEMTDIVKRMAGGGSFRDVVLPVTIAGERRYWMLSAKPVFDNAGILIGYHGFGADVTDKKLAEERILHLARYDSVSGLPNRVHFNETVELRLNEAREHGQSAAMLCLDLDQFKSVNDTLGHHVGDMLLKHVGRRIRACARGRDIVARLGGDEFAILQIGTHEPVDTMILARQIIDAFKTPFKLDHGEIAIGTSIGIAVAPQDGWTADAMLKKADMALYSAKADGAGTYRFFEPEMEAWAHRRRALEVGLRSAIDNRELHLVFQPLIDMRKGAIAGCEALLRWKSPEWGFVSPAEFIPVAEAAGLIEPIGEWVLREAARVARDWPDDTTVAVNLSAVQFKNLKLLSTVVGVLAETGLPAHRLELEVTESVFIDGSDTTLSMLQNLRALGVRTALDDFGTGYSSLSYLRRYPFDKVKIDKSFIDDVAARDDSLAIIRAIVTLAGALGMSTTAEGVESVEQLTRLRDAGCTQIQGYVFSPPRPAADIAAMFARERGDSGDSFTDSLAKAS